MVQKKVSTIGNNAAAVINLDDDEQLVEEVTTTKRIGRQRRAKPPENEPTVIEAEDFDDDDDTDDPPEYSETSLAALIYGDSSAQIDSQYCTVVIRRDPDSMNDNFLEPCSSRTHLPRMMNVELSADRGDIEERVAKLYGGGHYFFQLHFNNRLQSSWKATLPDDPFAVAAARAEKTAAAIPAPAAPAPPPVPVDPMTEFLDNLEKQRRMKDLLFGDEEKRHKEELESLRAEIAAARAEPSEPKSERLTLLETALATQNGDMQSRIIDHIFPPDEKENRHWIADTISVVLENKEVILGLVGSLLGGLPQPQPAAAQPPLADILRGPIIPPPPPEPPGEIETGFRRREYPPPGTPRDTGFNPLPGDGSELIVSEPPPDLIPTFEGLDAQEVIESGPIVPIPAAFLDGKTPDADADAIDAEVIEEKPKRRAKSTS